MEVPVYIEQADGSFLTTDKATPDSLRAEAKRLEGEGHRAEARHLRALASRGTRS